MTVLPKQKKRLAVIGVGSVGLLNLVHFCTNLDNDWEIVSIHNPGKKILGIGESTNGEFVSVLEKGTGFRFWRQDDLDAIEGTLKFGSKFANWSEETWINPLIDGNIAVHFSNFHFKEYVYDRLQAAWPDQFSFIEGHVNELKNGVDQVLVTVDQTVHTFDYVVDCMGFPSSLEGYVISDCSPVNHGLVHSITDFEYEPFTDQIAMKHGWMFGVPLQSRKTFGYLYNDTMTSKETVQQEMKDFFKTDRLDDIEYKFQSYYTPHLVEGRICKNGNKASFFEPLVANSIHLYLYAAHLFMNYINENDTGEDLINATNKVFVKQVKAMANIISYYYQGGSVHQSDFWDYAEGHTKNRLTQQEDFKEIMAEYKSLKNRGILTTGPNYGYTPLTWQTVESHMNYGYL